MQTKRQQKTLAGLYRNERLEDFTAYTYTFYYYYYYYCFVIKISQSNVGFCFFFRLIIGQNYFGDPWNVLDFIIVLGSIADIVYTELSVSHCLYQSAFVTSPPRGVQNIVMSMFVCLSVCLSVHTTQKPYSQTLPHFCARCLWPLLRPSLTVLRYVMYFQLCG